MMDELQRRDASLAAASARAEKPSRGAFMRRTLSIEKREVDEEARTVELAFSSESPVERWYGIEVLSHDKGAMRMDRLNNGAALLLNHDAGQHIGVVESARMDNDKRGRAVVRFGRSALAEEVWQDVRDGIRSLVSVGYMIHEIEETTPRNGIPEIRVTDWEPLEVSIVSVPADASVGVGRHFTAGSNEEGSEMDHDTEAHDVRDIEQSPDVGGGEKAPKDTDTGNAMFADRSAVDTEIKRLAAKFGKRYRNLPQVADDLIAAGGTVEDMNEAVRHAIKTAKPEPVPTGRALWVNGDKFEQPMRYKKLKAFRQLGEEQAYRMGMWGRAVIFGDSEAARWCKDAQVRTQIEGTFTAGGALVPDEMSSAIIDLREEYGVMRGLARLYPMGSDTLTVPRRTGGVTAYFAGEDAATTESSKTWDNVELVAREVSALSKFSMSLAEDAIIDLAEDLASEMAYAFAVKEDDCAINGDGTSTYGGIVGIRTKIIDGTHTAGAIDATSGTDNLSEVDADDLDLLRAALPQYASREAKYLVHKAGKVEIFDAILRAAGGNTQEIIAGAMRPSYLGDEIVVSQSMFSATTGTTGNNVAMLLYGNFMQGCSMGDRRGFTVQVLRERYAEYRQVGVIASERFAFVAHDLGDTSTAGPIVALIGAT